MVERFELGRWTREGNCQGWFFVVGFCFGSTPHPFPSPFSICPHQGTSSKSLFLRWLLPPLFSSCDLSLDICSSCVALAVTARGSFRGPSFTYFVPTTLLTAILSSCLLTSVFSVAHLPCLPCKSSHLPTQSNCLSLN